MKINIKGDFINDESFMNRLIDKISEGEGTMPEKEIRNIQIPVTVEEREDGATGSIYGYPIVYNKDSEDMGFIERIAPGAAKKALKKSDIRGLKNHDPNLIFARQGKNLKFEETKDGLRYEATPINTHNFREIAEEVRLGLLDGQSFGFTVAADKWSDLDTDKPTRTITEIDRIYDVGPVTYPAYPDTTVALRSLEAAKKDPEPQFEIIPVIINGETYDINDVEGIDSKLQSLRSESKPTLTGLDNADDEPTLDKSPEVEAGADDVLLRIDETIARLKNEDS